ncbi:hypothetical protein Bca101_074891 [Brassica carinata]
MNLDDRGGKAWSCGGDGENVVWLFLGVANTSIILHDDEFLKYLKDHQENFRSVFTGVATTTVTLVITTTDHFSVSHSMSLILSVFFFVLVTGSLFMCVAEIQEG